MGERSAASWEEQWGNGLEGEAAKKKESSRGKKVADVKAALDKAKSAAVVGALKIKTGTSLGLKWVKNHCNTKSSSK